MKIENIISCVNLDDEYYSFIELMVSSWQKYFKIKPVVGLIKNNYNQLEENRLINSLLKHNIKPMLFDRIDSIDSSVQAKLTRLYMSTLFEDTCNMLVDINVIPLSQKIKFTTDIIDIPHIDLIRFGEDDCIDKTYALGSTFKKIINPQGLEYEELLRSWSVYDQNKNNFSDALFFKSLCESLPEDIKTLKLCRNDIGNFKTGSGGYYGRLERHDIEKYSPDDFFEVRGRIHNYNHVTMEEWQGCDLSFSEISGKNIISPEETIMPVLKHVLDYCNISTVFQLGCNDAATYLFLSECDFLHSVEFDNDQWKRIDALHGHKDHFKHEHCRCIRRSIDKLRFSDKAYDLVLIDNKFGGLRWNAANTASATNKAKIIIGHDYENNSLWNKMDISAHSGDRVWDFYEFKGLNPTSFIAWQPLEIPEMENVIEALENVWPSLT